LRPSKPATRSVAAEPAVTARWEFKTNGAVISSPAVGQDGTLYISSGDGYLYALTPAGGLKWEYQTGEAESSPVVVGDSGVYVSNINGALFALNQDGTLRWRAELGSHRDRGAVSLSTYSLYAFCQMGALCSLDPGTGEVRWQSSGFHTSERGAPVVTRSGVIVVSARRGRVLALADSDGSIQWGFPDAPETGDGEGIPDPKRNVAELSRGSMGPVAIGGDDTLYAGGTDKNLYALTESGIEKWHFTTGGSIVGSPAIGADGTIYVGSRDRHLYAINPDGSKRWDLAVEGTIAGSPALAEDGTVYFGDEGAYLYAATPEGTMKWRFNAHGAIWGSPAIAQDGTVYCATQNGMVYAVPGTGAGALKSGWSRSHRDNGNTGSERL
jgi:outer membrane protein assembly factor BamB